MQYYLAIDIGASSGRHIAAWRDEMGIQMKEVYRFKNLPKEEGGHLVWDLKHLCNEVVNGLRACHGEGITPCSIGIDTWAVDYVLLDKEDMPIGPMYCYRDGRGEEGAKAVHEIIPFARLYERTGIQYQSFNTIYQLYWDKLHGRLDGAKYFLMLPEYLSFYLCGQKTHEYTNASTTGLLDVYGKNWDMEIIQALGLPEKLFQEKPKRAPYALGRLKEEFVRQCGFECDIILPATHDTASAIAALPQRGAYISSGTWSLLGAELKEPVTSPEAMTANFTNEGGIFGIRFLKNIMGLWLIQCLKHELKDKYSFAELADMAREEAVFDYRLDVNAKRYLAPQSVIGEIQKECRERAFPIPQTPGEFAHAIYQSLAHSYGEAFRELEKVTKQKYDSLCIVGGGVNNSYLNELTEQAVGCKVIKGCSEATALGNILLQEANYVSRGQKTI